MLQAVHEPASHASGPNFWSKSPGLPVHSRPALCVGLATAGTAVRRSGGGMTQYQWQRARWREHGDRDVDADADTDADADADGRSRTKLSNGQQAAGGV